MWLHYDLFPNHKISFRTYVKTNNNAMVSILVNTIFLPRPPSPFPSFLLSYATDNNIILLWVWVCMRDILWCARGYFDWRSWFRNAFPGALETVKYYLFSRTFFNTARYANNVKRPYAHKTWGTKIYIIYYMHEENTHTVVCMYIRGLLMNRNRRKCTSRRSDRIV